MSDDWIPNVLVVDDDADALRALRTGLAKWARNWNSSVYGDARSVIAKLGTLDHAVIVSDRNMLGTDGPTLCQWARELVADPGHRLRALYFIILSGAGGTGEIIHALDLGADDYVTKPCSRDELVARIHVGSRTCRVSYEYHISSTRIEALTGSDGLTCVDNRQAGLERSRELLRSLAPGSVALTLAIVGVQDLAQINQCRGFVAGDACLGAAAKILVAGLGEEATIVRWSGSQFVVGLCGGSPTQAAQIFEDLLEAATRGKAPDSSDALNMVAGLVTVREPAADPMPLEHSLAQAEQAQAKARSAVGKRVLRGDEPDPAQAIDSGVAA